MTDATRRRAMRAARLRGAAAATVLVLLPPAAGALTIYNEFQREIWVRFYDQNDVAEAIPCYAENLSRRTEQLYSGAPGTCGIYPRLKVRVEPGTNCHGHNLTHNGYAKINAHTETTCSVTVTP